jgi:hypothetical protein
LFLAVYFFVKANLIRQLDREVGSEFSVVSLALAEEPGDLTEVETELSGRVFRSAKEVRSSETPPFKRPA